MPHQRFIVAGEYSKILNSSLSIELPTNITFTGLLSSDQLPEFYKKCRVILFLSKWYETFGMILIESMSYGVPVMVYNLAAIPEIIENEREGFVIEMGDMHAIIEKINLLFQNNDLYQELSMRCVKKFTKHYTSARYYDRLMEIIQ
jgi:glycosyltransferase involved in cell wall biosynthesis